MSAAEGGWRALSNPTGDHPSLPKLAEPGRVVGLGAICDLGTTTSSEGRSQGFSVSEFVTLEDGRRVILHEGRGFTVGWGSNMLDPGEIREGLTPDSITRDVLNTVLPDDDECGDDHPWSLLAHLAGARGLDVTEEHLRNLGYEVILSDKLIRWLAPA